MRARSRSARANPSRPRWNQRKPLGRSLASLQANAVVLIDKGTISSSMAKEVFAKMYDSGRSADEIVSAEGLAQNSDEGALLLLVKHVIAANTATGNFQKTTEVTSTHTVPVSSSGGTLKARMYPTPITVPGSAAGSKLSASMTRAPGGRRRSITYAVTSASTVPMIPESSASFTLWAIGHAPSAVESNL